MLQEADFSGITKHIKEDSEEEPSIFKKNSMGSLRPAVICVFFIVAFFGYSLAEDPYRFFTWNVTWGTIWPLGIPQRV